MEKISTKNIFTKKIFIFIYIYIKDEQVMLWQCTKRNTYVSGSQNYQISAQRQNAV